MRLRLLLYILLCLPCVAFAQTITVENVNISAYPIISADVNVFDVEGAPVRPLSSSDLELTVNNKPTSVRTLDCPPPQPPLPMWAVVACDRSQSMNQSISDDLLYIDLATAGMSAFVKAVDFEAGDTRVALMVFDTASSVIVDFSADDIRVGTEVGGIEPIDVAGTNYNRAFLDPFEGAIALLKRVPIGYERVLVLLSDGAPTAGDFDFNTILQEVLENNIVVYPIIIKEWPSYQLQQLAARTGGQAYGGIVTREEMRTIYSRIARRAQLSKKPCKMTWEVEVCDTTKQHTATLRHAGLNKQITFTYNITIPLNLAKVDAGRDETICDGASIALHAKGTSSGTYSWSPAEGLNNPSSPDPVATPEVTTTYKVTFTDSRGCIATDEVTVRVLHPFVDIPVDSVFICRGETATLSSTGNGDRYSWSPTTGLESPSTSAVVVVRPTATTTYHLTASLGACTVGDSVTVVVVDLLNALDLGEDVALCADSSVMLVPTGIEGQYHWFPATGLDYTDIRTPVAKPAQTTTYYLTVTTASGCSASDSITVTVHPRAVVDAGANALICPGRSTVLTAQAQAGEFAWSPATGLDRTDTRSVTASPLTTTVYTVVYTDQNGCIATDEVTVTVSGALVIDAGEEQATCPGGSVQLAIDGSAGSVLWTPAEGLNDRTSRNPVASPAATTMYTAVVTSPDGCIGIDSVRVVVYPKPTVDAGRDAIICDGMSTQLSLTGSEGTYRWSPATDLDNPTSPRPMASPAKTTMYKVEVIDPNGCRATDSVLVTVRPFEETRFSLTRKEQGTLIAGEDDELVLKVEGIDRTKDTIFLFTCRVAYDMASLQYRPGSITVGSAASGWTITASEQIANGLLVIHGTGPILDNGVVATLTVRPYLSSIGAGTGKIEIEDHSVSTEAWGCVIPRLTATTIPVERPCITASRAIRYTGSGFGLKQNAPNPAVEATTIEFSIAFDSPTTLALYNALGEQVMLLTDEVLTAGSYNVSLPISNLPSGLYYYRLTSGPYMETRQMMIGK